MPPRDWRPRIEDVFESIAKIERYTHGLSYEAFAADELRIDAVLRNIAIIGEAARSVPPDVQARTPGIPWRRMQAMRNVVVHSYASISLPILWETTRQDLPPLIPLLRELLEQP